MEQDPTAVDIHVSEMRRRNERWLAGFLASVAGVFLLTGIWQLTSGSPDMGAYSTVAVAAVYAAYYGAVMLWGTEEAPRVAQTATRTVLEVSVPTWLTLLDSMHGAEFALPRSSVVLYAIAIFATVLRLRPRLAVLAGSVAVAEWLGTWLLLAPQVQNILVVQASPVVAVNRSLLLGACGFLAWRIARSHLELTGTVVSTALERERVRRAFGAYVAEPVVQRILDGDLAAGTERRPVAVLFCDIRSFTTFAEKRPPDEVLTRLNAVLEAFSRCVQAEDGIVNKYLGDGLMAIFGAPEARADHALAATRAAAAIVRVSRELSEDGTYPGLRIGVGVHCGEVVVGDIGGEAQREYTAIGDVVNVASRVEGVTKQLGVEALVTDAVRVTVHDALELQPVEAVQLRGRSTTVKLWQLIV